MQTAPAAFSALLASARPGSRILLRGYTSSTGQVADYTLEVASYLSALEEALATARRLTSADVAEKCGVSVPLARTVLNGYRAALSRRLERARVNGEPALVTGDRLFARMVRRSITHTGTPRRRSQGAAARVRSWLEDTTGLGVFRTFKLSRTESLGVDGDEVDVHPCGCGALWSEHGNNAECPPKPRAAFDPYAYAKVSALEGEGSW